MPLDPGRRLGPYEIVTPLGAGGMGEVYEARDTRLGRRVAIKVLPEALAEHPARRARFEREARAVSQLSHPHVCTLHDIGQAEGVHFLVLEHCEGETLAARLGRGPLPLQKVLRFGAEVAEALDAAHRRGVIHRDLKPANIMLTGSGVKLLDFGLARLAAVAADPAGDVPTMTLGADYSLTEEGTVLGTYPYMSPEQAEGGDADPRSDIFALGAVLYEMATGSRAFDGESAARIMAAVLREDPEPVSKRVPLSPPALDHVVARCLAKDAEARWQSARDIAGELRWIAERAGRDGQEPAMSRRVRWPWTGWAVAGVLAVLVGILAQPGDETPGPATIPETVGFSFRLPDGLQLQQTSVTGGPVEIAPDGSFLVFSARQKEEGWSGVFRRSIDSVEISFVEGTEGGRQPFVSPDSRWIGFYTEDGGLAKVPAGGGIRQRIFDGERLMSTGAAWGPDGRIYFTRGLTGGLGAVSASGGGFEALTTPDSEAGEIGHWFPRSVPEHRDLLFGSWTVEGWKNFALDLDKRTLQPLRLGRRIERSEATASPMSLGGAPHYVESGHLVVLDKENLIAIPYDIKARRVLGDPVTVLTGVASFHASWGGSLVYLSGSAVRASGTPTRWTREGEGPFPLGGAGTGGQLRLSPDGARLAIADTPHVWLVELERGVRNRFTDGGVVNNFPVWSPDGTRVLFNSLRAPHGLYVRSADRLGEARLVLARSDEAVFLPASWSPDGNGVAITKLRPDGGADVAVVDIEAGRVESVVATAAREHSPAFSPNGRWLAYVSDESGRDEIYLRPYPDEGRRVTVSIGGGKDPRWSADGRRLYFRNGRVVYEVVVDSEASEIRPAPPSQRAELPGLLEPYVPFGPTWDVAPNGDLVYLRTRSEASDPEIFVISGWSRTLPEP